MKRDLVAFAQLTGTTPADASTFYETKTPEERKRLAALAQENRIMEEWLRDNLGNKTEKKPLKLNCTRAKLSRVHQLALAPVEYTGQHIWIGILVFYSVLEKRGWRHAVVPLRSAKKGGRVSELERRKPTKTRSSCSTYAFRPLHEPGAR